MDSFRFGVILGGFWLCCVGSLLSLNGPASEGWRFWIERSIEMRCKAERSTRSHKTGNDRRKEVDEVVGVPVTSTAPLDGTHWDDEEHPFVASRHVTLISNGALNQIYVISDVRVLIRSCSKLVSSKGFKKPSCS